MIVKRIEAAVKQNKDKVAVKTGTEELTYGRLSLYSTRLALELVQRLKQLEENPENSTAGLLLEHGNHQVIGLLGVLKAGMIFVPLDTSYPRERLEYMILDTAVRFIITDRENLEQARLLKETAGQRQHFEIIEIEEFETADDQSFMEIPSQQLPPRPQGDRGAYIIYTSGSTGKPKGVLQTDKNVCGLAELFIKEFKLTSADRQTYISSFSTDGMFDDIFPALFAGVTICAMDIKIKNSIGDVPRWMKEESITVYHSVTTVYRYLVSSLPDKEEFPHLRLIITGGEPLRTEDIKMARQYFPGLEFSNFYAMTESSVNAVKYIDTSKKVETLTIGDPVEGIEFLLLDENGEEVDEMEKGEIFIASPYIAAGYWNNPEQTAKVFLYDPELGPVYRTGDQGRMHYDGTIEFLGRMDFQVKIRGYRVEPGEIETRLAAMEGISAAVVTGIRQDGENQLCAYIEAEKPVDRQAIRQNLSSALPDHMIPAYIIPVEKMPLTSSGKIDRHSLPEPEIDTGTQYLAPRNEVEKTLVDVWAGVLKIEADKIGIHHTFFELGGHSLKATTLSARMHKALNVKVPVGKIFETPTIAGLAQFIRDAREDTYTGIPPAEEREYYECSPAQRRFYVIQQLSPQSVAFNMPNWLPLGGDIDRRRLERTIKRLIHRHESLRTAFRMIENRPVQVIYKDVPFKIQYYGFPREQEKDREHDIDPSSPSTENSSLKPTREEMMKRFIRPFDLSQVPLMRVSLTRWDSSTHILQFDMHHIISDGTSQQVLRRDFLELYSAAEGTGTDEDDTAKGQESLRLQYRDFSQWQHQRMSSGLLNAQEKYWLQKLGGPLPLQKLPVDRPHPEDRSSDGARIAVSLGNRLTSRIKRMLQQTGTTLYMLLQAAFTTQLMRYGGQQDIIVGSPIAGRTHEDLENIMGLIIGSVLIRNKPQPLKTFDRYLEEVKASTLEAYENQDYPFEKILERLDWQEQPGRNPVTDVALIVHNMLDPAATTAPIPETQEDREPEYTSSKMDITIHAVETADDVRLIFEYGTAVFDARTIRKMAGHLKTLLKEVVQKPDLRLEDIEIIDETEKQRKLGDLIPTHPLSHPQKRIYQTEIVYPGTAVNTLAFTVMYRQNRDRDILEKTINEVIRKNDALRLRIVNFQLLPEPRQYITPWEHYPLETLDFSREPETARQNLEEWLREDLPIPFETENSGLFKFVYIRLNSEESGYYMKFHHYVFDGWSLKVLMEEVDEIYNKLSNKLSTKTSIKTSTEISNEISTENQTKKTMQNPSYIEIIREEREYLNSPQREEDRRFWIESMTPLPDETTLVTNSKTGSESRRGTDIDVINVAGGVWKKVLSPQLRDRINEYGKANRTTVYKQVLAALALVIARSTGNTDVVIGGAGHNRTGIRQRQTLGMTVSTFPIRIKIEDTRTYRQYQNETAENLNKIIKHRQRYPFDLLQEELRKRGGEGNDGALRQILNINLVGHGEINTEHRRMEHHFSGHEPTPLTIHINDRTGDCQLELEWIYREDSYTVEEIKRIHRALENIISEALAHPDRTLKQLEMTDQQEREEILKRFNRATENETITKYKPVHQTIAEQAQRTPEAVALEPPGVGTRFIASTHSDTLSYRQIQEKSKNLAAELQKRGVGSGTIIALKVEPSAEMIIGIHGILHAGAAYLPIDPETPGERIDYILSDSNAKILLVKTGAQNPKKRSKQNTTEIINFDELKLEPIPEIENRRPELSRSNLAYIIYTSGTTGRPKGVMVEHRNLSAYLEAFHREFQITADDVVVQQASFTFDASVEELYPIMQKGGKLVQATKEEVRDVEGLVELINRRNVTMITASPLLLEQLNRLRRTPGIRHYISGGDRLKSQYIDKLVEDGTVTNTYGPTEATVCGTYYKVSGVETDGIPIGKPIAGYTAYVMDANARLQPVETPGELCIGGLGVTRGYLNRPELTAEKYIENPYRPGERVYRTGDRVSLQADGNLRYLGRIDRQIKIRGYRIEPGEIEKQLSNYPEVRDAVVMVENDADDEHRLTAYLVGKTGVKWDLASLRVHLNHRLPGYMIPERYVNVDTIPRTLTGKVDYRTLTRQTAGQLENGGRGRPPQTDVEKTLERIWKELLGDREIGIDDNFFELGGHSLKAVSMAAKIHKALGRKIQLSEVYGAPTIRELAKTVAQGREQFYRKIEPAPNMDHYPQSPAQKRLFVLEQMGNTGTTYHITRIEHIKIEKDKTELENVFKALIERHESLRTSFHLENGEPVQQIHPAESVEFKVEPLRIADQGSRKEEIDRFIRPFDLTRAPLLRVGLQEDAGPGEGRYMVVDMHHIIADGVSMGILVREFLSLLTGTGQLPPLRLQYRDYSHWLNQRIREGELELQERFWVERFAEEPPRLVLPMDNTPPAIRSFEGAKQYFQLTEQQTAGLKRLARQQEAGLFMVVLAMFNQLLSRLSGQEDIVVGTPVAGRNDPDLEPVIGMFVNTQAMRNYPTGEKTFREFLNEVRESTLQAFENQEFPFEDLVARVVKERDTARNPLFDVMMVLQNNTINETGTTLPPEEMETAVSNTPVMEINSVAYERTTAKFDLTLEVFEKVEPLAMAVEYGTRVFQPETIRRIITYVMHQIDSILEDPDRKMKYHEILSDREKQQIQEEFNGTQNGESSVYGEPGEAFQETIHRLFEEQVEKTPENIAFICEKTYSYRQLNEKADRVARHLVQEGVLPGTIVALEVNRSVRQAVGILGVLKAGGAYLPIDPEYPAERIRFMKEDSNARLHLTETRIAEISADGQYDEIKIDRATVSPGDPAYVIYTSGTTGRPRGVMVEHRSAVNTLLIRKREYGIGTGDVSLQLFSYAFDGYVTSFFTPLISGAAQVQVTDEQIKDIAQLKKTILQHRVTHFISIPVLYQGIMESMTPQETECIKIVTLAGDMVTPYMIEQAKQKNPHMEIAVEYGVTEAAVMSTMNRRQQNQERISIGRPAANMKIWILDRHRRIQPIGVPGELIISGIGLARGYLNKPELTADKFIEPQKNKSRNFFESSVSPGARAYKTGDLARWRPDGTIEFLGRIDQQVKIRGYRIELGEIESALLRNPLVTDAVVTVFQKRSGRKNICAYIVAKEPLETNRIKEYLSNRLPDYMIPAYFMPLEEIPLTPNGKLDRKKLPEPEISTQQHYVEPQNDSEKEISKIWSSVLEIDKPGAETNFFELGGNSIDIIKINSRIKEKMGIEIPVVQMFRYPTVRSLAEYINRENKNRIMERKEEKQEGKSRMEKMRLRRRKLP
jgi:amino acid adenylation domain-containing protein